MLVSFQGFKAKAKTILKVVSSLVMPPCSTYSAAQHLCRIEELTHDEQAAIDRWCLFVAERDKDPGLTAPTTKRDWSFGTPDSVVVFGRGEKIPVESARFRKTYEFRLPKLRKRSLVAFDILPSNLQTLRFARLSATTASGTKRTVGDWSTIGFAWRSPRDYCVPLAVATRLEIEAIYFPTGKPEDARFRIGLYFSRGIAAILPEPTELKSRETSVSLAVKEDARLFAINISPQPSPYVELYEESNLGKRLIFLGVSAPNFPAACNFIYPVRVHAGAKLTMNAGTDPFTRKKGEPVTVTLQVVP